VGFLFLLFPAVLFGQSDEVWSRPLDGQNRTGFYAVCNAMSAHPLVKGDFIQTKTLSRMGRTLVSKGIFIIDAERGMIWDTRSPFPSILAVGRDHLIQIAGGKKTSLDIAENETFIRISKIMSAVFTGKAGTLTENFEVFFSENAGSWKMGLIPKDGSIRNFAASILMQGDSVLRSVLLREQNGNSVEYDLANHSYPGSLTPSERENFSL
jgi:hypothetical protein